MGGKYEKKKVKKTNKARDARKGAIIAFVLLLVVVLAVLALFVMPQVLYKLGNESENTDDVLSNQTEIESVSSTDTTDENSIVDSGDENTDEIPESIEAVAFPLLIEEGKLEIESIIQYDGLNPDCGNQEGNDIAAITVRNVSDVYVESAEISMTTNNGDIITFMITDLPAGETVFAFSQENTLVKADTVYGDVICEAVFDADANMSENQLAVSVDGTVITLQNKTNESLSNIVVYCHSTLGDQYFGGITYTYSLQTLPANGSAEVDAVDCILGLAEVVRITINKP